MKHKGSALSKVLDFNLIVLYQHFRILGFSIAVSDRLNRTLTWQFQQDINYCSFKPSIKRKFLTENFRNTYTGRRQTLNATVLKKKALSEVLEFTLNNF